MFASIIGVLVLLFLFGNELKGILNVGHLQDFDSMIVSNGFHSISLENGQSWKLSYEESHSTSFSGIVRHTSEFQVSNFSILSHDILVTSGDFANPELVSTDVSNHRFVWRERSDSKPRGTINLLHTVPMNQEIFLQLQEIQNGDKVTIKGWEVGRIEGWNSEGKSVGYWQDSGCNTTLVTGVIIE